MKNVKRFPSGFTQNKTTSKKLNNLYLQEVKIIIIRAAPKTVIIRLLNINQLGGAGLRNTGGANNEKYETVYEWFRLKAKDGNLLPYQEKATTKKLNNPHENRAKFSGSVFFFILFKT